MNWNHKYEARFSTSEGKFVCVHSFKSYHQLVTANLQLPEESSNVTVFEFLMSGKTWMAFLFEKKGKSIFPVVTNGDKVEFKELPSIEVTSSIFNQSFMFEWGEGRNSGYRSLKSVAKPGKFLGVVPDEDKVTIRTQDIPDFKIVTTSTEKRLQITKELQCCSGTLQSNMFVIKKTFISVLLPKRASKKRKIRRSVRS
ncbi:hypothetical protein DNTS_005188 [Danionella cerebrum]|uniref:Uncharacterized protein n=1 Tax=Danionella cerebrum TaxID=2873325 RepID=A0A553QUD8_9TELE|nr:hypothetical protein DNTS_005188 [Danionella translucida]